MKTVNCGDIDAPTILQRPQRTGRREIRDLRAKQSAAQAIAGLTHENEIYGLTMGQFSMLQLLQAIIERTGPINFALSTWTAAKWEIGKMTDLLADGKLLSARWLIDFTFARRDPGACHLIRTAFGLERMRVSQVHSKFALFGNDEWKVVLRTSMNLNMTHAWRTSLSPMTPKPTPSSTASSPTSGNANEPTSKPNPSASNENSLIPIVDTDPFTQAVKWIVAGNTESDVLGSLKHYYPDIDAAAVSAAAAAKIMQNGQTTPPAFIRGIVIMGLMANHQKAFEMGDIAASTRALKLLHDIAGK